MNGAPQIKGWCPGALRPMLSGDGWVVRVRPRAGRLTQEQAAGIAQAAREYGNGILDVSSRANIQIRGVKEEHHVALIAALRAVQLIDESAEAEARRNVIVSPFASDADRTMALALETALTAADAPRLPGKFGFAVDIGPAPVLADAPADIRLERSASGDLILCADGRNLGRNVDASAAIEDALALASHFLAGGGAPLGRGRMRAFVNDHSLPDGFATPRQATTGGVQPDVYEQGALVGLAFGQITAETLAELADLGPVRLTPWRMILIEGATQMPCLSGLITHADDPLLRVVACTGAPGCVQAKGDTRSLARALAGKVHKGAMLHVSGCTKGCAHPQKAASTITATDAGYDLIHDGRAADKPTLRGLTPDELNKAI